MNNFQISERFLFR